MGTFAMPSLGADMEAGTLVEWLKQPGDELEHGDIIAVVETDKGAIEVEVFESGKLNELLVEPGSVVPVGSPLARIGGDTPDQAPAEPAAVTPEPRPSQKQPPISPAATKVGNVPPAGIRASPAARQLAEELDTDLAKVEGSGPDGAIIREDVFAAAQGAAPARPAPVAARDPAPMRRAIAAAMARSKREIPHYYLTHRFDISPTDRKSVV